MTELENQMIERLNGIATGTSTNVETVLLHEYRLLITLAMESVSDELIAAYNQAAKRWLPTLLLERAVEDAV